MKFARPTLARPTLALALLLPVVALAQGYPRADMQLKLKPYSVDTRDFSFPSGLRVLFQSDHSQPIVAITTMVDHGSSSDPVGLEGIAHFVEHMWFRSRHPLPDGSLSPKVWDMLKDLGANLNASTADDWTNYMSVAPKHQIIPLMRLEGLRLVSAVNAVENEVLLVEREVVRNELRMRYENGGAAAYGYLYEKLFPKGHAYARLGIGTHDSLNAITLADVQKFVKDFYKPENTTIVVVGDFSLDEVGKFLDELPIEVLADPKNPKAELALVPPPVRVKGPQIEPPVPPQPILVKGETEGVTVEHGAVEYPTVVIGWTMPSGYRDEDVIAYMAMDQIANSMLAEMFPSWEWDKDEKPLKAYGCYANPQKVTTVGVCWIELRPDQDGVDIADKALNGLYRAWIADDYYRRFQDWNFQYARTAYMASIFRSVDMISSLDGRATGMSAYTHYSGSARYYSDQFEMLNKINADQIRKYAEKYLNRQRAVAVVLEPYEDGDIDIATGNATYRGARRDAAIESTLTEKDLTPERIASTVVPIESADIKSSKLPNGMGLVVMPYSTAPVVEMAVKFRGGTASFDWGKGQFAAEMSTYNGGLDALAIAGQPYILMGDLSSTLGLSASAGNVEDGMYFLRDFVDNLIPYTDGRIDWVKQEKVEIKDWMTRPDPWAEMVRLERLLPNHYMSRWVNHQDLDTMNTWGVDVSRDVWSRILRPENADIFIVGNVTVEEATKAATTYFGKWQGWGKKPADWAEPNTDFSAATEPPKRQVILLDKEQSSQTEVHYACQLEPVTDDGNPIPNVLGDVISEETWLALREQTGASYGAYAYANAYPGGVTMLEMAGIVQNDTAAAAAKVFLDLGEKAKAGRLDSRLTAIMKYNRAQGVVQRHQAVSQTMGTLLGVWDVRDGYAWWDTYGQRLGNVNVTQMSALMPRCVGHEVVTLIGPKVVVEPQLAKSGLPYEVFDWKQAGKDYRASMGIKEPKEPKPKK